MNMQNLKPFARSHSEINVEKDQNLKPWIESDTINIIYINRVALVFL